MSDTEPVKQKKRGCFFYGCLTCLVVLLVAGVALFFAVRYALHRVDAMVAQYTETTPMAIEKTEMPADDLKKLNARLDAFAAALNAHTNAAPLVLTAADLNALLADNPKLKVFKNDISIALDGDEIKAQLSLPLELVAEQFPSLKALDVKGRYLNGSGTFKAFLTDGKLSVFVQSLTVKGQPMPEKDMAGVRQQNLADILYKSQNPSPFAQYQSIEVKNSTVIVTPKPN